MKKRVAKKNKNRERAKIFKNKHPEKYKCQSKPSVKKNKNQKKSEWKKNSWEGNKIIREKGKKEDLWQNNLIPVEKFNWLTNQSQIYQNSI